MGFLTYLRRDLEQIFFKDRDPHAIPSMDGAFSPNDRLDHLAPIGEPLIGADAAAVAPDGMVSVSAENRIWQLSGDGYQHRALLTEFDSNIGALAYGPDGQLVVCTARGIAKLDAAGRITKLLTEAEGQPLRCLTAIAVAPDGAIFVCDGSTRHSAEDWCVDLMERNQLGRIIACGPALDNARVLLRDLNYPAGLAIADDRFWFTESFAHRLSRAPIVGRGAIGTPQIVIRNLPGYPSRLTATGSAGFWLSLFAVRTHLVEFVLREDDFSKEMMLTIPRDYWVAPALTSGRDCLEPLQVGALRALGVEKPWAPPRSYGLAARLDANGDVVESLHSRVGGRYHGITAAVATPQGVILVSKGAGRLLLHRTELQQ